MKKKYISVKASSAPTVLYSITLHTYRGKFDQQNLVFMNMHEAGETNLLSIKLHVTLKYSSISSNLLMPNKSLALATSLMEVAILNAKPNLRYKM